MKRYLLTFLLLAFLALAAFVARAEPDAPFTLTGDAVVSSSGASRGGPFTLSDVIGEPAAGVSSGDSFTLVDGSAAVGGDGAAPPASTVYLPAIVR